MLYYFEKMRTITSITLYLFASVAFGQICDCNISGSNTSSGYFYVDANTNANSASQIRLVKWGNGNAHLDIMDGKNLFLNYYKGGHIYFGKGANTNGNPTGGESHSIFRSDGKLGVNTLSPQSNLHVKSTAVQMLSTSQYDANLIVEGSSNAKLTTEGAALGFVVPAATNGGNTWQQGRILVTPDNTSNSNANGRMFIQTRYYSNGTWQWRNNLVLKSNGNVGIGTTIPTEKLSVNGTIRSKEVKVEAAPWPDYVFATDYALPTLSETETYIQKNHRLPNMPSAEEVAENGIALGEMNRLLVEKVEELTLYVIELKKENEQVKAELSQLPTANSQQAKGVKELTLQIKQLENRLTQLENDK